MSYLGVILALVALFAWGFGDFFIQRSVRVVGIWAGLFFICFFGAIVLTPFIWGDLRSMDWSSFVILLLMSVVLTFAALFDFKALKEGKLAVVEPLLGIELPLTVALSAIFIGERLHLIQLLLIFLIFIGIILAVTVHRRHLFYHRRLFERGVILAGVGAVAMSLSNFLMGLGGRQTSALFVIWFSNVFIALVCAIYILHQRKVKQIWWDLKKNKRVIAAQCFFDNIAWIAYAAAMVLIPIGVATAISESYIVLTIVLGIFINKEKLKRHQLLGAILAASAVVLLSIITANNGLY